MESKFLNLPFDLGRVLWLPKKEAANLIAGKEFSTGLVAEHFSPSGDLIKSHDLGSGLTTNVGSLFVAALYSNQMVNIASPVLNLFNFHASGTGATAAATTDIALQTSAGPTPATGTQSNVSVANTAQYKTVGTLNYVSTLAITEWGLFSNGTLSASTGTPFTATSATSGTVTGTPLSAHAEQGFIVVSGTVYGLIYDNTSSVLTIGGAGFGGWWNVGAGTSGTTPGSTAAYTLQPVMWDHKVFSAINVNSGDSIQFTYTLTINSGG